MAREYPERIIDSAINKARKIPRKIALLKIRQKEKNDRPIFIIKYDPRLPTINSLTSKHWRSMVKQDKYLEEVFQEPPLTAYRRQRNLRDILIKAKVPPAPSLRPKRDLFGMSKCGKICTACPYVKEGKTVKVNNQEIWIIQRKINCKMFNCIYMLECNKCGKRYVDETGRMLKARFSDHRG